MTLRHTGYGVFISVLSGSASELGPFIQGPLTVLAGPNTTVLLKWAGTFHGEMNGVDLDGNKIANVIGFWLTNSTTGGSYYNLFQHLLVRNCGIDYLFQDTAGATGSIGDNTFVNCKAQSAQWSGSTWAASTNYSTAAIVVPTSSNWNGTIFKCTTPGTSGSTEPNWSAATLIGDKINDGTLTWTRVSWDDQTSVPSPGIGWLFSNGSQGETVIGGDAESNQGYGMAWIGWDGSTFSNASYTDVYGLWNENNGNKLTPTAPYHALLLDSTTNTQSTATAIDFDVHLLADNGYFDGLSLIGAGSNVPGNAVGQRVMVGEFGDSTGNFRTNFLQANTAFLAPDGTASYPGVAFFSEQRTGFARTANGQITADLNKSGNTFSPFMFNTDGFYLYEPFYSESTTFANLPACSTATKFAEANITDGPASPSWHQAVTAGGGSTPMKLYCNGTDWTVEAY